MERGLVLSMHAGWGQAQGVFYDFFESFVAAQASMGQASGDGAPNVKEAIEAELAASQLDTSKESPLRLDVGPRRAMWQLMIGGVFDRHPGLRLALTEIRADWLPATLRLLDREAAVQGLRLRMKPSEYFAAHCAVAPSSIHRAEVEMRHDIGVGQLLFGIDYPHHEGTWPNTAEWIQSAFAGVPEDEARRILGENAIDFYALDRAPIDEAARRIAPATADVLVDAPMVPEAVFAHFDKRAGYRRAPSPVDENELRSAFAEDVRILAPS